MERSQFESNENKSIIQTQSQTQRSSQVYQKNSTSNIIEIEKPQFITKDIYESDEDQTTFIPSEIDRISKNLENIIDPLGIFSGLNIFVEIFNNGNNQSDCVIPILEENGAIIHKKILKSTNFIIFKEGRKKVIQKALDSEIKLINPLWIHDCTTKKTLLKPENYQIKKTYTELLMENRKRKYNDVVMNTAKSIETPGKKRKLERKSANSNVNSSKLISPFIPTKDINKENEGIAKSQSENHNLKPNLKDKTKKIKNENKVINNTDHISKSNTDADLSVYPLVFKESDTNINIGNTNPSSNQINTDLTNNVSNTKINLNLNLQTSLNEININTNIVILNPNNNNNINTCILDPDDKLHSVPNNNSNSVFGDNLRCFKDKDKDFNYSNKNLNSSIGFGISNLNINSNKDHKSDKSDKNDKNTNSLILINNNTSNSSFNSNFSKNQNFYNSTSNTHNNPSFNNYHLPNKNISTKNLQAPKSISTSASTSRLYHTSKKLSTNKYNFSSVNITPITGSNIKNSNYFRANQDLNYNNVNRNLSKNKNIADNLPIFGKYKNKSKSKSKNKSKIKSKSKNKSKSKSKSKSKTKIKSKENNLHASTSINFNSNLNDKSKIIHPNSLNNIKIVNNFNRNRYLSKSVARLPNKFSTTSKPIISRLNLNLPLRNININSTRGNHTEKEKETIIEPSKGEKQALESIKSIKKAIEDENFELKNNLNSLSNSYSNFKSSIKENICKDNSILNFKSFDNNDIKSTRKIANNLNTSNGNSILFDSLSSTEKIRMILNNKVHNSNYKTVEKFNTKKTNLASIGLNEANIIKIKTIIKDLNNTNLNNITKNLNLNFFYYGEEYSDLSQGEYIIVSSANLRDNCNTSNMNIIKTLYVYLLNNKLLDSSFLIERKFLQFSYFTDCEKKKKFLPIEGYLVKPYESIQNLITSVTKSVNFSLNFNLPFKGYKIFIHQNCFQCSNSSISISSPNTCTSESIQIPLSMPMFIDEIKQEIFNKIIQLLGGTIVSNIRLSDVCIINKIEPSMYFPPHVKNLNQDVIFDALVQSKLPDLESFKYKPKDGKNKRNRK